MRKRSVTLVLVLFACGLLLTGCAPPQEPPTTSGVWDSSTWDTADWQ